MENQEKAPSPVPNPAAFRGWIQDSLADLGVSAARVSREAGLGRNAVAEFLRDQERSLTLRSAHDIADRLQAIAREKGRPLPTLGGRNA